MVTSVHCARPGPARLQRSERSETTGSALQVLGTERAGRHRGYSRGRVFIGSCTNSRLDDLRAAAHFVAGSTWRKHIRRLIVPGSRCIIASRKRGLEKYSAKPVSSGATRLQACASAERPTSLPPHIRSCQAHRPYFRRPPGKDSRTHLVSPVIAAVRRDRCHFVDVRSRRRRARPSSERSFKTNGF